MLWHWAVALGTGVAAVACTATLADSNAPPTPTLPLVINTWEQNGFTQAAETAWSALVDDGADRLSAVVAGGRRCQDLQCDGSVGYGGSPDENGETTLDAIIMDGPSHLIGAVGALRGVKDAIGVARAIMDYSKHSMLVGDQATEFAREMGFEVGNLTTSKSVDEYNLWKFNDCQPNYRKNVIPNPSQSCGPYSPDRRKNDSSNGDDPKPEGPRPWIGPGNHDSLGLIVVDSKGDIAAGVTTNGASHKIPGRIGDSPIVGAGVYVDNDYGAAAATGDGDVFLPFLPCYQTVEFMRSGLSPQLAAEKALTRVYQYHPDFKGALVAANKQGEYGAACYGTGLFPYSVRFPGSRKVVVKWVICLQ